MLPSELLTAAADRLRDLAAAATPGPWRNHDTWLDVGGYTATVASGEGTDTKRRAWLPSFESNPEPDGRFRQAWADAEWIAALSPAVAPVLEAFIRCAAVEEANPSSLEYGSASLNALMITAHELARQVLGVGEEQQR